MHKNFLFLCFLVLVSSCGDKGYDYSLEEQILDCYIQENSSKGLDVESTLITMEAILIEEGQLNGQTGKDYLGLVKNVQANDLTLLEDSNLLRAISQLPDIPTRLACDQFKPTDIDTTSINNSRLINIRKIFEDIEKQQRPSY